MMITIFWTIIIFMTLMALAFVVLPLLRSPRSTATSVNEVLDIAAYNERLAILQEQLKNNEITSFNFEQAKKELAKTLLDEIGEEQRPKTNGKTLNYFIIILIAVLLPIFATGYYWYTGASQQLIQNYTLVQHAAELKTAMAELNTPDKVIAALKTRLQENPNSAQGWFLLGKVYSSQKQFANAVTALAKANQLEPDAVEVTTTYAEAIYFANNNSLTPTAEKLLHKILQQQPNNINVINLLAINAYQHKNYQVAINYWENLLPLYPPDSDDSKILLTMIARAQQRLGKSVVPTTKLIININTTQAIKKILKPNAVIFIYAKAVNGPAVPLAVTRVDAKNLPITVSLDDTMSMLPSIKLSDYRKIEVFAKISQTGQIDFEDKHLLAASSVIDTKNLPRIINIIIKH